MAVDGWVGLDVGTTSSKAVVYDGAGRALGQGRSATTWRTTADGVELDPRELLAAATAAVAGAVDAAPDDVRVRGLGITSMGETGVLVDGSGEVVAPSVAWHDVRDGVEVEALRADLGEERFGAVAGKPLRGQFSVTKHRWLVAHEAGLAGAVRRFNVAEWVARGLTGEEVCDRVLACRTGWFDVAAGDWWDEALDWSGASRALMPPLVDAGTAVGRAVSGPARLRGAVVTTAGHDHQAAAVGVGAFRAGDELDSSGTAEALVRTVHPDLDGAQRAALARRGITTDLSIQPGRWSLLGGTEGGLALQRALEALGVTRDGLADLDRAALAAPQGDSTSGSEAALAWRAAVERATGDAGALHEAMTAVVGPHARLVATGGWCHSTMVLDAKRRVLGPLTVSDVAEAGTLGAATLAARAAGELTADEVLGTAAGEATP